MLKQINQINIQFPDNRDDMIDESVNFEEICVSVGGYLMDYYPRCGTELLRCRCDKERP